MKIDKLYCMSSYLSFRYIGDESVNFFAGLTHTNIKLKPQDELMGCSTVQDIDRALVTLMGDFVDEHTAILLSGGMDSAILAAYMPRGAKAYTMKCVADGAIDETSKARRYADAYGLDHQIVEIHWSDYLALGPDIMRHKGAPIHSIEAQLYKVALQAKKDGITKLVIGESADLVFGGMDKLLSQDWTFEQFVKRYTFVDPVTVLKEPVSMLSIYEPYRINGTGIDFLKFMDDIFSVESSSSYLNSFTLGAMDYSDPFGELKMNEPLDLKRIRNGEPKYLIRELFAMKYPEIPVPNKIPMPRAVDQWLADWEGPKRPEFLLNCVDGFTGDQKWLVYCLEWFLNLQDQGKI